MYIDDRIIVLCSKNVILKLEDILYNEEKCLLELFDFLLTILKSPIEVPHENIIVLAVVPEVNKSVSKVGQ